MSERFIRPYRPADRTALIDICAATGAAGGDARGMYRDDQLLADVYALPYVERDAGLAFVIDDGGTAVGYVLGTDDTDAFDTWFRSVWWPVATRRYAADAAHEPDAGVLRAAATVGAAPVTFGQRMPAHLHIDILPAGQGGGFGRRLVETFEAELRRRAIPGYHLVASAANENALGFYDRLGLDRLASEPGTQAFGRVLTPQ